MAYDKKNYEGASNAEQIFSKRIKAGKRRTYFFDVRETRGSDYFITITESKKRFNDDGYERHKVFIYKEDFNKFIEALTETADYVKKELLPDFDFDSFRHDESQEELELHQKSETIEAEKSQTTPTQKTEGTTTADADSSSVDEAVEKSDSVESWKI